MSDTAEEFKHAAAGAADKAAGAVTGDDGLKEKADEHLDEAAKLDDRAEKSTPKTVHEGVFEDPDPR
jgi:hypothetical protein